MSVYHTTQRSQENGADKDEKMTGVGKETRTKELAAQKKVLEHRLAINTHQIVVNRRCIECKPRRETRQRGASPGTSTFVRRSLEVSGPSASKKRLTPTATLQEIGTDTENTRRSREPAPQAGYLVVNSRKAVEALRSSRSNSKIVYQKKRSEQARYDLRERALSKGAINTGKQESKLMLKSGEESLKQKMKVR